MAINYFRLLSRSAVEQLLQSGPEFKEFLDRCLVPGGPVRRFPNGAVEIDDAASGDLLARAFVSCDSPGHEIQGASVFKTLGPFEPKHYYYAQYREAYQEKLRSEVSFHVSPNRARPPAPGEFDLDRLEVMVEFRTRVGKAARRSFVAAMAAWASSASDRGAFEDGPIFPASPGVQFSGTRARFNIDARLSGQDTLNWLALVVLDFGEDVHTTTGVYFGSTAEFLDAALGPVKGEWELVEYPGLRPKSPKPSAAKTPAGFVPPGVPLDREFASRKFPVLAFAWNEWDSFVATIYFGRPLLDAERGELAALIEAWSVLGSYGGFEGVGTHSAARVKFDDATDSASLRADMGDACPSVALPVLIRALEGFETGGAPIDALVFGRPLRMQTGAD